MTLREVGIVIGKDLEISFRPFRDSRYPFTVWFEHTGIRAGGALFSARGVGRTIAQAKKDYCKKLKGVKLEMDFPSTIPRQVQLPKTVTLTVKRR